MSVRRLENVGVVVADLDRAVAFFECLGLELQGRAEVSGDWVDRTLGLDGVRSRIALLQTPDGHGRLELQSFQHPPTAGTGHDPLPRLGMHRLAFDVVDLDATVAAALRHGATLVGEVVQYQQDYRICYLRGPEGIVVMLSEALPRD